MRTIILIMLFTISTHAQVAIDSTKITWGGNEMNLGQFWKNKSMPRIVNQNEFTLPTAEELEKEFWINEKHRLAHVIGKYFCTKREEYSFKDFYLWLNEKSIKQ